MKSVYDMGIKSTPWFVKTRRTDDKRVSYCAVDFGGRAVSVPSADRATAALTAAAPELYEMLRTTYETLSDGRTCPPELVRAMGEVLRSVGGAKRYVMCRAHIGVNCDYACFTEGLGAEKKGADICTYEGSCPFAEPEETDDAG